MTFRIIKVLQKDKNLICVLFSEREALKYIPR